MIVQLSTPQVASRGYENLNYSYNMHRFKERDGRGSQKDGLEYHSQGGDKDEDKIVSSVPGSISSCILMNL